MDPLTNKEVAVDHPYWVQNNYTNKLNTIFLFKILKY
jgi:hypothetical protein